MKNYYEILEVNPKASKEIIEKAYHVLSKKYHPDLYIGEKQIYAEKRLREINEAYHVLADQFLREQYDSEIKKQELLEREGFYGQSAQAKKERVEKVVTKREEPLEQTKKKQKVGTLASIMELTKELVQDLTKPREKVKRSQEMRQKDLLAVGLTVIVVILIGVILWFIPFTNGWMRELLFENPLFNWIGRLFS